MKRRTFFQVVAGAAVAPLVAKLPVAAAPVFGSPYGMFVDLAGTILATKDGDKIMRIRGEYGMDLIAASLDTAPTYRDGIAFFDGVSSSMRA